MTAAAANASKAGRGCARVAREASSPQPRAAARGGDRGGDRAAVDRRRDRSAPRSQPQRTSTTTCWNGFECRRQVCYFFHPEGRRIDGVRTPPRRRSRSAKRRSGRSPAAKRSPKRAATPVSRPGSPAKSSSSSSDGSADSRSRSRSASGQKTSATGSFRQFVLTLHESVTAEEAVAKFKEHLRELAAQGLERFKGTGLFFDMYHPLANLRLYDLRVRSTQRNAEQFAQALRQDLYKGLSLSTAAPGTGAREGASCRTAGHMKAPHYAFDPDVNGISLKKVPPLVSVWDIHDVIQQCAGFLSFACSKPAPDDLVREVRVNFASAEDAQAASRALADEKLEGGHALGPAMLNPASDLSGFVAPPEMSLPDRICKDEAISAQVVRLLDRMTGVPASVTEAVLGKDGPTEAKLDVQVLYLRRVHHFCFYAAAWCNSEWELHQRCGTVMIRDSLDEGAGVAPGAWTEAHEQRLSAFLEKATLEMPTPMSSDDKLSLEKSTAQALEQKTNKIAEGKFQCAECSKLFRGPEFVHKHLRKVHTNIFETIQQDVQMEAACKAFLADPISTSGLGQ